MSFTAKGQDIDTGEDTEVGGFRTKAMAERWAQAHLEPEFEVVRDLDSCC